MKVLVVEPMKPPCLKEIVGSLESLQSLVGGMIQIVYPFDDKACVVCNDEGKLLGMPVNRFLKDINGEPYDVICGTFFVAGIGLDDLVSLSDRQIKVYSQLYDKEYLLTFPVPYQSRKPPSHER